MVSNHLRLEVDTALADGGQEVMDESDVMRGQIQALIAHVEGIPEALQGSAQPQFSAAGNNLASCFDSLLDWCQENGVNLNEANAVLQQMNNEAFDSYSGALGQIDGLARGVNG